MYEIIGDDAAPQFFGFTANTDGSMGINVKSPLLATDQALSYLVSTTWKQTTLKYSL